ncbi:3-beta hydroxysteroid dehydrogenase [Halobacteriales archaeon QS_5_70_17]|nr:MAG: 3-beta hydroxysteroid dehydrogenase [Halobacteriales archaeon QS_5_70_17]
MRPEEATVLVAGASGRTGREAVDALLDAGIEVRALTSRPAAAETLELQGADEVIVGDLLDPGDAGRAVGGVDAVLCAVGSSLRDLLGGPLVDGEGTVDLVTAAAEAGVERFALVSSIGVGDSRPGMPSPFRVALDSAGVLPAKERAERRLRASDLSHTILRPGGLTGAPATGDVLVGEGGDTVSGTVPRADVARLLAAAPFTPAAEDRTFEVVAREGLRGRPSGLVDVDWSVPVPVARMEREQ